ncbi:MAG: undecaprenyl/decaprenyl-phosphate alpha-N-acetylglucosaminyl 1-phosphate transferase [Clostridia bacterium]|nr:undecaprenyl/decaprenyl-phosphate alpha-N-acetylglucosaminyl 1-phosphate transferase [Clostridia bacterium]
MAVILGFVVSVIYLLTVMTIEKKIDLHENNYHMKLLGFAIGGVVICVTCFYDDVKGAPALVKLFAQIVAACIVVKFGIVIENVKIPFMDQIGNDIFYKILTIGWIIGVTNAINLIDGLDGLSTGITLISCISLLIIFSLNGSPLMSIILITALAGALVGFLPFNFNPAKTFIGDTGSNFLGYCISIISIIGIAKTYTAIVIIAPIIVLALPIFDTIFAIFRRMIKGHSLKAVMQPDANHLHHKMLKAGFTQKQSVLILYGITAMLGIFVIIWMDSGIWKALSFAIMVAIIILVGYKEFFKQRLLGENEEEDENVQKIDKEN